ncbi:MAG: magnesium transporter [Bacteroidetes bacterium]|nr:magnesium transporter [Bacteroidota bacterium]
MTKEEKYSVKDFIQVDNELIENIADLIESESTESILSIFADLHYADIAEIINHLRYDDAYFIFGILTNEIASEVLPEVDENLRERILKNIDPAKLTIIIDELETDDATDILSDLPDDVAEHVLENIDREDSDDVKELLKYEEDTAGGIMTSDFVFVNSRKTVANAIDVVRANSEEIDHIYYIYVLDDDDTLKGVISLKSLLIHPLDTPVTSVMEEDLIYVHPEEDQEEVANVIEKYDLVSLPVVDENKKMLGRITIDDVVDVIQEEASEDIQRIAGLSDEQETGDSIFRISRIRLPWLIIGLIGELGSALVLSSFQASIEKIVIASFFIPIVMAMGGSSGTQAAIVMVRGLSTGDIWMSRVIKNLSKEFGVALLNGLACSIILLGATYYLFESDIMFSVILSVSLVIIMTFATMIGSTMPVLLKKMNIDPAIATGPFVTTTNDIFGLIIYLSLITMYFTG